MANLHKGEDPSIGPLSSDKVRDMHMLFFVKYGCPTHGLLTYARERREREKGIESNQFDLVLFEFLGVKSRIITEWGIKS
jgi:hypothetical protein